VSCALTDRHHLVFLCKTRRSLSQQRCRVSVLLANNKYIYIYSAASRFEETVRRRREGGRTEREGGGATGGERGNGWVVCTYLTTAWFFLSYNALPSWFVRFQGLLESLEGCLPTHYKSPYSMEKKTSSTTTSAFVTRPFAPHVQRRGGLIKRLFLCVADPFPHSLLVPFFLRSVQLPIEARTVKRFTVTLKKKNEKSTEIKEKNRCTRTHRDTSKKKNSCHTKHSSLLNTSKGSHLSRISATSTPPYRFANKRTWSLVSEVCCSPWRRTAKRRAP
jgi:hypothetical protein